MIVYSNDPHIPLLPSVALGYSIFVFRSFLWMCILPHQDRSIVLFQEEIILERNGAKMVFGRIQFHDMRFLRWRITLERSILCFQRCTVLRKIKKCLASYCERYRAIIWPCKSN